VCGACGNITYRNPLPVAVMVAPVDLGGRVGVLAVRRAIAPRAGWLALPGGFIEVGESWQEAAARELHEETGVTVRATTVRVFTVHSAPDVLIVFGQVDPLPQASLPPLLPTAEASAIVILTDPVDLAFPLHTLVLREYLA
jgi:ADP-ribose pyrophosphatase YjhB (NUDIX family)